MALTNTGIQALKPADKKGHSKVNGLFIYCFCCSRLLARKASGHNANKLIISGSGTLETAIIVGVKLKVIVLSGSISVV